MDAGLRRLVWQRAGGGCEYCRIRQEFDELTFQIEHVIPRKHPGTADAENPALACFAGNNHKGTNRSGLDPRTGELTRLFHPRCEDWNQHFGWNGAWLAGRTAIGRATIDVLAIKLPHRRELRLALMAEGVFP